ncbi:hypothetical protein E2C01_016351 [Portunus trituberculatus]|uniref:Uncharacterized protein n=1 Tax=Portunus trituberculatus TaxID=210409 RepID=A0A5B7DPC0_PORTR|nr:hypothetical protein [Portunus trituberculatus]
MTIVVVLSSSTRCCNIAHTQGRPSPLSLHAVPVPSFNHRQIHLFSPRLSVTHRFPAAAARLSLSLILIVAASSPPYVVGVSREATLLHSSRPHRAIPDGTVLISRHFLSYQRLLPCSNSCQARCTRGITGLVTFWRAPVNHAAKAERVAGDDGTMSSTQG